VRKKRRLRASSAESEVNLTPMLDVVFIMLIFFIVTASFTKEAAIDVTRSNPNEQQQQTEEREAVLIQIDPTGLILLNGRRIDLGAVRANIERSLAETPDAPVVIRAARSAKNGVFVKVLDDARRAGASQVAIAAR